MSSIGAVNVNIIGRVLGSQVKSTTDPAERFNELDTDGDGGLDTVELSEEAKKLAAMTGTDIDVEETITTYDADNDGLLNQDEMMTMIGDVLGAPPERQSSESTDSATQGMGPMMPPGPPPPPPGEIFSEYDTDEDESLSEEELTVFATDFAEATGQTIDVEASLSAYDENGDGVLSQLELDNMMQALREQNGGSSTSTAFTDSGLSIQRALEAYIANSSDDETVNLASDLLDRITSG